MRLTKAEAIRECKLLWLEIQELEMSKQGFLDTPAGEKWRQKEYHNDCPVCQYVGEVYIEDGTEDDCLPCPLVLQYDKNCYQLGFREWMPCPDFWSAAAGLKEENGS